MCVSMVCMHVIMVYICVKIVCMHVRVYVWVLYVS